MKYVAQMDFTADSKKYSRGDVLDDKVINNKEFANFLVSIGRIVAFADEPKLDINKLDEAMNAMSQMTNVTSEPEVVVEPESDVLEKTAEELAEVQSETAVEAEQVNEEISEKETEEPVKKTRAKKSK